MPAPYSAGSIFLQVSPSFRGVPEQIAREAREWPDQISDGFDERMEKRAQQSGRKAGKAMGKELNRELTQGAEESGRQAGDKYTGTFRNSLRRGLASAQRELETTPLKLVLNDEDLRGRLTKLRKDIHNLDRKVELGTDATGAFIELRRVLATIEKIQRDAKNVEVRSNVAAIHRELAGVAKHIQTLSNIDIEPNLKVDRQLGTFERRLKAGIKKALEDLPPLNIDDGPAYAKVEALRERLLSLDRDVDLGVNSGQAFAEVLALEAAMRELADTGESMKLRVDGASGFKTVAAMRAELEALSRITIEPEVDVDRQLGAFERGVKGAIDSALRDLGAADVGVNSNAGQRAVADLRRQLYELGDRRIGIDISAETVRERLIQIREELQQIQREHWDVSLDADTAAAEAHLGGFLAALETIDGRHVDIDIDVKDAVSATTVLRALEAQSGRTNRALQGVNSSGRDGANSFRAFNARILGIAALGPLVVPAIGAIAGAIGGLAVLGAAAGAALGVLILGLTGVGSAFKAMGKASQEADRDLEQRTKRITSASRSVGDAERSLARAREDAARANSGASRQVEDALRGVQDAERGLRDAQREGRQAQEDLTRARKEAAEQLEDLQLQVRGGEIDARQAALDLREAEAELADARKKGLKGDDLERYLIGLERAKLRVDQTKESNADLREEQERWAREGIEGSDVVVAAQERVRNSQQGIADAERGLADAQRAVADARADATQTALDGQRAVSDALRNLAEAQADYQAALDETSTSQRNLKKEMEQLGPAGQEFVRWLDEMRGRFKYLRTLAQEGFLPGLQDWISSLVNDQGPRLERVISTISGALGDMFRSFGASIRGDAFTQLFELLDRSGPRLIGYLTDTLVNLGEGLANFIVGMEPLGDIVGGWLVDLSGRFNEWTQSIQGTQELQDFFDYVVKAGPLVGELLLSLAEALLNIGKAISPFAFGLAQAFTGFFNFLAEMDPETLGPIVVGLTGLVVALQAIFAISSALISIRVATHLTGIAFGGLLSALAKIGGVLVIAATAFAVLYSQSEGFRKAVNTLWNDVLVPLISFLGDAIADVLEPLFGLLGDNIEIVAGLAGAWASWKIITTVIGWVKGLATAMAGLAIAQGAVGATGIMTGPSGAAARAGLAGPLAAGAAGGAASASRLIPGALATWGAFELTTATDDDRVSRWRDALLTGGADAEAVRNRNQGAQDQGFWASVADNLFLGDIFGSDDNSTNIQQDFNAATEAADEYWRSLPLVEQAQQKVAEWTKTLDYRMGKYGETSELTEAAQRRLAYWSNILGDSQADLATDVAKVNEKLVAQQSLTIALSDAEAAFAASKDALDRAFKDRNDAIAQYGEGSEEARAAEERWSEQSRQTAETARQVALTRHANADAAEREAYGNAALLADLERQKEQYGSLPPRLEELRASLAATVDPTILAVTEMENLGLAVLGIPDDKTVVISGDTPQEQLDRLNELGFTVTHLEDGTFAVTANTDEAAAILDEFINTEREITIGANVEWSGPQADLNSNRGGRGSGNTRSYTAALAGGGPVFGPGTWTSDSIPAYLSNGEYVVRAASVAKYGLDFFDALNQGRIGPEATGFRRGGRVRQKQGRPAFQDGGLAVNWGGSMALSGGNVGPLAAAWWQAVGEINNAARAGVTIMARTLSAFAQLAQAAFGGIATMAVSNWQGLTETILTQTVRLALGTVTTVMGLRTTVTTIWTALTSALTTSTTTFTINQVGLFAKMTAAINLLITGMKNSILITTAQMVLGIVSAFGKLPASLAVPVNTVIDKVINRGLIAAFNGIVSQLGTGAKPLQSAAGVKLATGGRVPGSSPSKTADNIPAWLTAGEYVHPVDSVDYYGPEVMDAIRKRRIPREVFSTFGYASGGYVAMGNIIKKQFPWARITSDYRPGDPGYHGKGLAVDIGGAVPYPDPTAIKQMLEINHWIAKSFANITELIHTQPGAINLWHGQPHRYDATTALAHRNHVHWAQAGDIAAGGVFGSLLDPSGALTDAMNKGLEGFGTSALHNILRAVPTRLRDYMSARLDGLIQSAAIAITDQSIAAANLGGGTRAANRILAEKLAAARGWVGSEWTALDRLIMKESGYNNLAQNPTSTAFGIGQFLDSTWATVGGRKTTDPGQQLEYMYRYIDQRYQTPSQALGFHLGHNYYGKGGPVQDIDSATGAILPDLHDTGGWVMPGLNVIMNRTGKPEPTINPQTLEALYKVADSGGQGGPFRDLIVQAQSSEGKEIIDEAFHQARVYSTGGKYQSLGD